MRNFIENATVNTKYQTVIDYLAEQGESAFVEFLTDRQTKAQKKSVKKEKPEDAIIKGEIIKAFEGVDRGMTATEIFKQTTATSVQKVNAMLKKMTEVDGTIRKSADKKATLFYYIGGEEE